MPKRNVRAITNKRKRPPRGRITNVPRFPQLFQSTWDSTHRVRFLSVQSGAVRSVTISRLGLINLLGCGVAPNSSFSQLDAIRVVSVKMYGVGFAGPSGVETITLRWTSRLGKADIKTATGNAFAPPTIVSRPPLDSLASFWTRRGSPDTTAADILFEMVMVPNTIIDITVEVELQNGGPFPVAILLASPATTGALTVVNLDNSGGNSPTPTDFLAAQGYVGSLSAA